MNCENCGAAMQLVESRRYFRCLHCARFHFPEPVEREGIRIVDKDFPVSFCGKCRGVVDAPGKDRDDRQRRPERDRTVEAMPPPLTTSMSPGEPLGFLYDLARLLN